MGQQWYQEINQKIILNKWKWERNIPKSMGHSESNLKRKNHSIIGLPQEKKNTQIYKLNLHLKNLGKQQTKPKVSRGRK